MRPLTFKFAGLTAVFLSWLSTPAAAQGFDAQRYQPAIGAAGGFVIERPVVPTHLGFSLGLIGNYGRDPVVVRSTGDSDILARPLHHAFTADLLASVGLWNLIELGIDLPIHAVYSGDSSFLAGGQGGGGMGDLRVMPKIAKTFSGAVDLAVGAVAPITFATGSPEDLRGSGALTVHPQALLGVRGRRIGLTAMAGYRYRGEGEARALLGNEVTYGLSAQVPLVPRRNLLDLYVEGLGGYYTGGGGTPFSQTPLEVLAGVGVRPHPDWLIEAGGGVGALRGVGTPLFRGTFGVRYSPFAASGYKDSDSDGVPDSTDRCLNEKEDEDGFEDGDGCPESDNDRDGVPDDIDECPDQPAGRLGASDGCPDPDVTYSKGRIVVQGKVQFETGSTALKRQSHVLLDRLATLMKENKDIDRVRVEGHTDEVGSDSSNQVLSEQRADTVRKELLRRGVPERRLESRGYGESRPIAPNKTAAGRAKNRRVDFTLIR